MHKYAYTIHYKQFVCGCPVWDTHNRRALLKFLLCYGHYGLIGIHNKTCNILFGLHIYEPAVAQTCPYGLRQGLGAGNSCKPHDEIYTNVLFMYPYQPIVRQHKETEVRHVY